LAILQPSEKITLNGAFHTTKVIDKKGKVKATLYVGKNGINIKENARVSELIVLD
jgi:alkyl hydroperoxide reductase subunit AhpC